MCTCRTMQACSISRHPGRDTDQIRIIYKRELDVIPFFGWGLRYGSYIGIDRGRGSRAVKSLEKAVEKIRSGASVLMYAEGTRTLDGNSSPSSAERSTSR